MKKRNRKHQKRVRKLLVGCSLCAIILTVSTYAWFIGMQTVNVSSFDVEIAAIDSLSLSLDGVDFKKTVTINADNYQTVNTSNNTNSWGGKGLIPMSTVGVIDTSSSRMILYEKGSLTATHGGYRLMASQVENTGATEADGYVAFDLYIKNMSGNEYYEDLNKLNEEAIYLTTDSEVKVAADGEDGTGIENSVRVAFAQIGRVKATEETQSVVTGITCTTSGAVTGICESRPAQIWEPNDTKHVQNAINWYVEACKARGAADLTEEDSYSGACGEVKDGTGYKTYAVSGEIGYANQVDVYDGDDYNGWDGSEATTPTAGKLMAYDTFTDSEKNYEGTARPAFMTLAPNSITKVRVYVYIEGQDIDNYDFASLGKKVSVAFGFTKERFFDTDVHYNETQEPKGPELPSDVVKTSPTE